MTVGKSISHDAALLHVTGKARYVDDLPVPANCLHLAFGVSEISCGDILEMDLSHVLKAEGVIAVLSAADLPFENDVSPSAHDEPMLADGQVHYKGQPIFLVVAETHLAARKAARLGNIRYSERPPVLTVDDAIAANSHFEDGPRIFEKGNAATAIRKAANVLDGLIEMGGQEHFYLEGQAALALPQENGDMLVHSSTQHPTEIQHKVAEAIGAKMHDVRVEIRRMGGGFGGKESQGNALAVSCAVAASLTDRPCKMRYDRDDDMLITGKRHDFRIQYRVGFAPDGKIEGIEFTQYARCGWALDLSIPVADRAMLHADNAYILPHAKIVSHRLKTNTQSATAFRGFGGPQGMLGIERVLDHIAHELGRDPLEVRKANFYTSAETSDAVQTTPYHMPVEDFILHEICDELSKTSNYRMRLADIQEWNSNNKILKKGIALTPVKFGISFTLTHLNQAGALVHVYQDGSIHLNHGGTEMGQGLFQKVAQVAATAFGVDQASVKITATDTAKVPNSSATAASSGTDLNGMAVKVACDTIRNRISTLLAKEFSVPESLVKFGNNKIRLGEKQIAFSDAAKLAYENRVSLSATGFYKTPSIEWDRMAGRGRPFFYFAYGAAVTECIIDTLTGENRILRTDILHDAGKSLNPALDIGQIEGGYVQGAGWLTTEELIWDDKGELKTHAPSTYKIPACSDRPDILNVSLWDNANPADTIYRSKAVGEPPFMLGISALLALSNAIQSCGAEYPALDAPATAERILHAIRRVSK